MKRTMLLLAGALKGFLLFAQTTLPTKTESSTPIEPKASNLLDAFEHGHFHGSFRSFFMATDNARQLSDYHALAAGGTLHFASSPWHGFSFGLGGVFNYNLISADLGAKDSITGAVNRYEIGLFDVEDPKNRKNLDRIEELWLRYQWKKSRITVGQQSLQTPFVNYQDGRMRPTAESGAWAEINDVKNIKMEGGYIWSISPRSTVEWFSVGESIGLYPKGLNPDGTGSGYPENLESMGIGMLGFTRQWGKHTKVQIWDQYVENIFNTVFVQADYTHPLKNEQKLLFGLQITHQDALLDGGNAEVSKTYFQKNGQSNVISAQTGWQHGPWQSLAAYTRITADGRFLSPREWGREPFYTFMARERVEGSGGSHSITGRLNWQSKNKKLRFESAYGRFTYRMSKTSRSTSTRSPLSSSSIWMPATLLGACSRACGCNCCTSGKVA
ncbi:MAG: OprD family outer membrane porin [Saprospiraceae bacterium]